MNEQSRSADLEVIRLRTELWLLRGRRSRTVGILMVVVGNMLLLLAYFTRYFVFEIVSVVALLSGIIFAFTSADTYVRADVARRFAQSSFRPLAQLLDQLGYVGRAVYLPPEEGARAGLMLVPKNHDFCAKLRELQQAHVDSGDGLLLPSTGEGLFEEIEEELSSLGKISLENLLAWLPDVLVEGLGLGSKAEAVTQDAEVSVWLWYGAFENLHKEPISEALCQQIGCPTYAAVGLILAKNTGKAVFVSGCKQFSHAEGVKMSYTLGPLVK